MSTASTYSDSSAASLRVAAAPVHTSCDAHWMLDQLREPVVRYRADDGEITYCNTAWADHHAVSRAEAIGRGFDGLSSPHGDQQRWLEWDDHLVETDDGTEIMSVGRDVTEVRRLERALDIAESTDSLTGLTNRRSFERTLDARLGGAKETGTRVSVVFLDLDAMKMVNERHGHEAGDAVLRETARRLTKACDVSDLVARLGGAEFAIVRKTSIETGMRWINRLSARLEQPIDIGHDVDQRVEVICRASIGVAATDDHGYCARKLLAAADRAMYETRNTRRGRRATDV